ncbi:MAG: hypothetical protein E7329_10545 [Clostridiales bacterium]|nr:hypothetical protein [Clostridiales bacterium]
MNRNYELDKNTLLPKESEATIQELLDMLEVLKDIEINGDFQMDEEKICPLRQDEVRFSISLDCFQASFSCFTPLGIKMPRIIPRTEEKT